MPDHTAWALLVRVETPPGPTGPTEGLGKLPVLHDKVTANPRRKTTPQANNSTDVPQKENKMLIRQISGGGVKNRAPVRCSLKHSLTLCLAFQVILSDWLTDEAHRAAPAIMHITKQT